MSTVGPPSACSQSPYTTGWPPVSSIETFSIPADRIASASHPAAARTSSAYSWIPEMLGIRRNSSRLARRAAWLSARCPSRPGVGVGVDDMRASLAARIVRRGTARAVVPSPVEKRRTWNERARRARSWWLVPGPRSTRPEVGSGRLRVRLRDGLRRAHDRRHAVLVGLGWQVGEELLELFGVDGLLGDELLGQGHELVAVRRQDVRRSLIGLVDDGPDLFVDLLSDLIAVVALLADLATEEHELVTLPEGQRAELVAHAELGDHPTGEVGRLLDVVAGTGRRVTEDETLGDVAAEETGDLVLELGLALEVSVLLLQRHRVAECHAAADDGDLAHRIALGQDALHDSVAALVVRDDRLLRIRDDARLALRACDDPFQCFLELGHPDDLLVAAGGQDRRLVHEVREVRSAEPGRLASDAVDVDALVERLALGVHAQDLHASTHVRPVQDDLPVEASRSKQRRVEDVRPVRGGHDDDVRVRVEPVHLDEDLVQGLLALVVTAAEAGATLAADRVDLIDEHDARRIALGLVEQVADAAG